MGIATGILRSSKKKPPTMQDHISEINAITQKAFISSISEKKLFQARFFFNDDQELIALGYGPLEQKEEARKINSGLLRLKKTIPIPIKIKQFMIKEKDELAEKTKELWILFFPEGYTQEVSLIIQKGTQELEAIINPFNGSFSFMYESEEKS